MSETSPALTTDEWEMVRALEDDVASVDAITFLEIVLGPAPDPHAAAAALLYDRAYGFTREMVEAIRTAAERCRGIDAEGIGDVGDVAAVAADRIAALLPPRG